MSVEKSLLKSLFDNKFYNEVKPYCVDRLFPDNVQMIWGSLKYAHEHYKKDINPTELKAVFLATNPAATTAQKQVFDILVGEVQEAETVALDVAKTTIQALWRKETARAIAEKAIDIGNGGQTSFSDIEGLLVKAVENALPQENYNEVSDDIDKLLEEASDGHRWLFNIAGLREKVTGIGHGEFGVFFARPETGKTAFHVSLCAAPNGFISQGASVHCIVNEEPAYRTMLRAVSAYTGKTRDEIIADPNEAKQLFQPVKGRLKYIDSVDFSVEGLDSYVRKKKPDILIVDQLDKIHVDGSFARTDERLKAIYVYAREIAKRNGIAVIGISQASADAEGKTILSMDQLENSRTGKAAEADIIIGIGKSPMSNDGEDSPARTINVLKNKITGWHGVIPCLLRGTLSRYEA